MFSRRHYRIFLAITTIAILVLSLMPKLPPIIRQFRYFDKLTHFVSYSLLAYVAFFSLKGSVNGIEFLLALGTCSTYGAIIEFLQYLTPRQTELSDIVLNVVGSMFGASPGAII